MSGASNRKRGHAAELAVVAYLRQWYPDAATTRSRLGHDGFHAPGDVIGLPGWCCEVKDIARSSWPTWCRQAEAEAGGSAWVVVRRLRGTPDVGAWPCRYWDGGSGGVMIEPGRASFAALVDAIQADDIVPASRLESPLPAGTEERT